MGKEKLPLNNQPTDVPSTRAVPVIIGLSALIFFMMMLNRLWPQLYSFLLFITMAPLVLSVISGLIKGLALGKWDTLFIAFRIVEGNFLFEKETGVKKPILVVLSRLFWEQPQTIAANFCMHLLNALWLLVNAGQWKNALVLQASLFNGSGLTLGSFILIDLAKAGPFTLDAMDDRTMPFKILVRHEYGHLLQSSIAGPLYLFKYGIPSLVLQGWTEADADLRSDKKLMKTAQFMPVFTNYRQPALFKNPRWWEYLLPVAGAVGGYLLNNRYGIAGGLFIAAALITLLNLKRAA